MDSFWKGDSQFALKYTALSTNKRESGPIMSGCAMFLIFEFVSFSTQLLILCNVNFLLSNPLISDNVRNKMKAQHHFSLFLEAEFLIFNQTSILKNSCL